MFSAKVITRLLVPAAAVVSEVSNKRDNRCRPSELPIYTPDSPPPPVATDVSAEPGAIENAFGTVRRSIATVVKQAKEVQRVAEENVQVGIENADWLVKYLGEEDNTPPKIGAIAVGGLAGFILGLRGGLFKRLVYSSAGALGMASICYPKEASEYSKIAVAEGKKYATIGYNFIYGVKKGDPPLELPTLKVPTSTSEVWDLISSFGKSKPSVTDPDAKEEKTKS